MQSTSSSSSPRDRADWFLLVATLLLLVAAFFRTWDLGSTPPGMHNEELINAQISQRLRQGDLRVIYDDVTPGREGLYYAILAVATTLIGRGTILWRLPSVWLTMLSLAVTAQLMRRLFGRRTALFTLGLMSVTFWPIWMGRSVLHVALLPLAVSGTIYVLSHAFLAKERTTASLWFTLGGLALGVSQYVHVTAWTLLLLAVLFVVYWYVTDPEELNRHKGNLLYAAGLAFIISLPLILFLVRHPGVREPVPITEQPRLITEIPARVITTLTALGLRGDMLPEHNLPGRPVLGPVLAILMVIGIGVAIRRWRRPSYGLALLWLVVGLLPSAFQPHRPDFEYMAVIMPIVFAFPAIVLRELFELLRARLNPATVRSGFALIATTLVAATAFFTFRDYFLIWPTLGDVRLNYQADLGVLAHYLDTSDDPTPISICSTPVDRAADPFAQTNEELLKYLMHRHNLPIRFFDCNQSLIIANGGDSQRIIFPRGHYYDHLPGPLLRWMQFAQDEQVPGIRPDVVMRFEASQAIADQAGAFITTALTAWPPEANATGLANLPISFGYNIAFLGYQIRDEDLRPGDWVELTTYWRVDGPPPPEMTQFAHMLGNPVVIVAQNDSLGVEINTLQVRDIFLQHSLIQSPGGLAAGPYTISVGLYIPSTGDRLPAFQDGQEISNRLFLQSVNIIR